jgi:hypothetical protein
LPRTGNADLSDEIGKRQYAAERSRIDRNEPRREAASGEDLGDEAAEGVPDDCRLLVQPADLLGRMVGDLTNRLAREHVRLCIGLLDGLRIVGPVNLDRGIARLVEDGHPAIPAAG